MYSTIIFLLLLLQLSERYVDGVTNDKHTCDIVITKESIDDARQKFDEYRNSDMRLVNIYLQSTEKVTEVFKRYELGEEEENGIMNWIWVSSESIFSLRLPVDIDAATFGLIKYDQRDIDIVLDLLNEGDNCTFNTDIMEEKVFDILFNNVTINGVYENGYLCHRIFQDQDWKDIVYSSIGIWVGFDFECFSNGTTTPTIVSKSASTYIVYIIEIVVLLVYHYIFLLFYFETYDAKHFVKGETPYSIKRITREIFYHKTSDKKRFYEPYVPIIIFSVIFCAIASPVMRLYIKSYKSSIENVEKNYTIYKFDAKILYLSFLAFFFFNVSTAVFIRKAPNAIIVINKYCCSYLRPCSCGILNCFKRINFDKLSKSQLENEISRNLVVRLTMVFTKSFWKKVWSEVFIPPEEGCCLFFPCKVIVNLLLLFVGILSCLSPFILVIISLWFSLARFVYKFNRYKNIRSQINYFASFNFIILVFYIFSSGFSRISLSFFFMPISYVTRIATYNLFISIPSLNQTNFQRFLIGISACTYTLNFLHTFLDLYKKLLDTMFQIKDELKNDLPINERKKISLVEFDTIQEKIFPFGVQVGLLLIKIVMTTSGIAIATIVLIENKQVESSSANVLRVFLIMFSPGVLVKLFITPGDELVKLKTDKIKYEMKNMQEKAVMAAMQVLYDDVNTASIRNFRTPDVNNFLCCCRCIRSFKKRCCTLRQTVHGDEQIV